MPDSHTPLTLLVTGANGQLGSCLRERAQAGSPHRFLFTDIDELDITSLEAVSAYCAKHRPDWIINCAAYTAVDRAESEQESAYLLNQRAVEILVEAGESVGASLLHISTDFVFEGSDPTPRREEDPTAPLSVYGASKLAGEVAAAKHPNHLIIRTSWLYSAYGNNFVKTMLRLGTTQPTIRVVADQWGSPTSAHDLAGAILYAIEHEIYGTYHYANRGTANWALLAEEVMLCAGLDTLIEHITSAEYPTAAARPAFSILDTAAWQQRSTEVIPEWEASLEEVVRRLVMPTMKPLEA